MYAAWESIRALPPPDVAQPEPAQHDLRPPTSRSRFASRGRLRRQRRARRTAGADDGLRVRRSAGALRASSRRWASTKKLRELGRARRRHRAHRRRRVRLQLMRMGRAFSAARSIPCTTGICSSPKRCAKRAASRACCSFRRANGHTSRRRHERARRRARRHDGRWRSRPTPRSRSTTATSPRRDRLHRRSAAASGARAIRAKS
jgi:hypothetical protein